MIFDAWTSFASTCLSAAESVDRSAPMLVGANRAAIFCNFAVSDTLPPSWAATRTTTSGASNPAGWVLNMKAILLEVRGQKPEVRGRPGIRDRGRRSPERERGPADLASDPRPHASASGRPSTFAVQPDPPQGVEWPP